MKKKTIKLGQKVRYKDGDPRIFKVYAIYPNNRVSLGLYDYPDTEQDYQVSLNDLKIVN